MRSDNKSGNAWVYRYRGDRWRVYFRVGGELSGTRAFPTKEEAEEEAERIRAEITMRTRSVGSTLDAYTEDMKARGLRPRSIDSAGAGLRKILGDVLDLPLSALTPRRCEGLYAALVKSGRYSASSHHLFLGLARAFGGWCAHRRRRWLRDNPFAAVEKVGEVADHRAESLRIDEARTFREKAVALAAAGDEGAVAALIALTCSLRPSEIVQIAARDVDDGGAVLHIAGAQLKTANTRRPIEVADAELRALLVKLTKGREPTDRLFPYTGAYVWRAVKRVAEAAGVPSANPRMLRRTFATLAARRGWSLDAVAFGMGHGADAKARTAQRHYIAPGAKQAGAAGRVLGVLDGGKSKRTMRKR